MKGANSRAMLTALGAAGLLTFGVRAAAKVRAEFSSFVPAVAATAS